MASFVPGAVGGSNIPILKANAKSGRFTFDDESMTEITFIPDLDNGEAGWLRFGKNMSPDFRLVKVSDLLAGKPYPAPPEVRDSDGRPAFRRGFRFLCKLPAKLAAGRPSIRELANNSLAITTAIDDLLRAWSEQRVPGKLPKVTVKQWVEIESPNGTNYQPRFEILSLARISHSG